MQLENPPPPRIDVDDLSLHAWLAAYLMTRPPMAGEELTVFVTDALHRWCRYRLGRDQEIDPLDVAAVVDWVIRVYTPWQAMFWARVGSSADLDSALVIIHALPLTAEEALLLARASALDISPEARGAVNIRPATFKRIHEKRVNDSLDRGEQNWAPTGTFTGGGARGLNGQMMPFNIMVSRGLCSPREILHALLFELENVKRWRLMEGKRLAEEAGSQGRSAGRADIEYETFRANQESLRLAYGTGNQRDLCLRLGVPPGLLQPVPLGEPVPRPDVTVLRDPSARNALWWFQTQDWPDDLRRAAWTGAEHGGGMASSKDLYKAH